MKKKTVYLKRKKSFVYYFKLSLLMLDVSDDADATADELDAATPFIENSELFWLSIFLAKLLTVCEDILGAF